jgi:hypothetical protein
MRTSSMSSKFSSYLGYSWFESNTFCKFGWFSGDVIKDCKVSDKGAELNILFSGCSKLPYYPRYADFGSRKLVKLLTFCLD